MCHGSPTPPRVRVMVILHPFRPRAWGFLLTFPEKKKKKKTVYGHPNSQELYTQIQAAPLEGRQLKEPGSKKQKTWEQSLFCDVANSPRPFSASRVEGRRQARAHVGGKHLNQKLLIRVAEKKNMPSIINRSSEWQPALRNGTFNGGSHTSRKTMLRPVEAGKTLSS